jgi:hypothetical protein
LPEWLTFEDEDVVDALARLDPRENAVSKQIGP